MEKRIVDGVEVRRGSGNIFADLQLPDAEKLKLKSDLVIEIRKAMRRLAPMPAWSSAVRRSC